MKNAITQKRRDAEKKGAPLPLCVFCLCVMLSGCGHAPFASVTGSANVGPITGANVSIGRSSTREIVPIVKTVKETCNPPSALLEKHDALPLITSVSLTPAQLVNLSLEDTTKYNDLRVNDSALIDWILQHCE